MGDAPDFIEKFHNLEGNLLSERLKSFHKLLKMPFVFKDDEHLNEVLKNIKPVSYQENILYIETLIHFKRNNELLEILKSGNDIYASKILKQDWFIEQVFKNIEANQLVDDFLPCLSYSLRKKFLNKISKCWTLQQMDSLFDALEKKYGLTVSVPILHKCTETKIQNVLNCNEIILRPNQVLELIDISEDLFKIYLDHCNKITNHTYDEGKVLNYVAKKNPAVYLDLINNKKIIKKPVSRRVTKKFLPLVKDNLITVSNIEHYFSILHKGMVIRKLGIESRPIYKELFPTKLRDLNTYSNAIRLLKYYPKNTRWNLFIQNYNHAFPSENINLNELILSIKIRKEQLKKLNPPNEIYQKWAELNYQKQEGNFEEYLKYYEPPIGIPLIKEKINLCSDIYKRKTFIKYLLHCCSDHNDLNGLEEVLKYICFRHRNEEANVRIDILEEIRDNFPLDKLSANHWKYIDEQLKILRIQKEFSFYVHAKLMENHLAFLFKNQLDYKAAMDEYIIDLTDYSNIRFLDLKNKSLEQKLYIEFGKNVFTATNNDYAAQALILDTIISFSVDNPEFVINIRELKDFEPLINSVFNITENFDKNDRRLFPKILTYNTLFPQYAVSIEDSKILDIIVARIQNDKSLACVTGISKLLLKKDRTKLLNSILILYFEQIFNKYPDFSIVNWLLKNEPTFLVPYFDTIVKNSLKTYNKFDFNTIKHYSHLQFDKKVCQYYKRRIHEENFDSKRIIVALSILLLTEDFKKFVEDNFLPKKDKLDLEDIEMRSLYKLQCDVVQLLASIPDPYKMLPTIIQFCKGDYLQSALRSLYKSFYRSPEKMLYPYVEKLSKMAVSVRKHAIFLSCELLDKQHALNMLKNTTEDNVSSQKHLFSAILKYFLKNPSQDLLEKVIESMNSIDKNDSETLESLGNVTVPTKFRVYYIENCWKYFENLATNGIKVNEYLTKLLNKLQEEFIVSLSQEFISHLIQTYFPPSVNRLNNIDKFVVLVIKMRIAEQNQYLDMVFKLLSTSNIHLPVQFLQALINEAGNDASLLNSFSQYWKKYFSLTDYLNETIELNLHLLKISNPSENTAVIIINYLEQIMSDLGHHAFQNFSDKLNDVVSVWENDEFSFILEILKYKINEHTCILAIDLISNRSVSEESVYKDIINILKTVDTPIVRARYKIYELNKSEKY